MADIRGVIFIVNSLKEAVGRDLPDYVIKSTHVLTLCMVSIISRAVCSFTVVLQRSCPISPQDQSFRSVDVSVSNYLHPCTKTMHSYHLCSLQVCLCVCWYLFYSVMLRFLGICVFRLSVRLVLAYKDKHLVQYLQTINYNVNLLIWLNVGETVKLKLNALGVCAK